MENDKKKVNTENSNLPISDVIKSFIEKEEEIINSLALDKLLNNNNIYNYKLENINMDYHYLKNLKILYNGLCKNRFGTKVN